MRVINLFCFLIVDEACYLEVHMEKLRQEGMIEIQEKKRSHFYCVWFWGICNSVLDHNRR